MSNSVMQAILDRRSIRAYVQKAVTEEQKQALLQAALASPSAINSQPWHFSFVEDQALLQEVNAALCERLVANAKDEETRARFSDPSYSVFYHAPLVVFISGPASPEPLKFATIDAGIAVENLALAAQGLGLGSVILGMPREAFLGDKGPALEKKLHFPEGYEFKIAISIGKAAATKDAHPVGENKYSFL